MVLFDPPRSLLLRGVRFIVIGAAAFVVQYGYASGLPGAPAQDWLAGWLAATTFAWILSRRLVYGVTLDPSPREWWAFTAGRAAGGVAGAALYQLLVSAGAGTILAAIHGSVFGAWLNYVTGHRACVKR
jgi:putative flippase GtrA